MKFFFCVREAEHPAEEALEVSQQPEQTVAVPSSTIVAEPKLEQQPELTVVTEETIVAEQITASVATKGETLNGVKTSGTHPVPVRTPVPLPTLPALSDKTNSAVKPKVQCNNLVDDAVKIGSDNKAENTAENNAEKSIKRDSDGLTKVTDTVVPERRVENIKLRIDYTKQNSVSIVRNENQSNEKSSVAEELASKEDKATELKIHIKKEAVRTNELGLSNGKSAVNDKSNGETESKLSPPVADVSKNTTASADNHVTVDIKIEKSHTPPRDMLPQQQLTAMTELKIETDCDEIDEKKSKFLNSICLTPRKSMSPEVKEKPADEKSVSPTEKKLPTDKKKLAKAPKAAKTSDKFALPAVVKQKLERIQDGKSSKRKSREPIKNITKKCRSESPCLQRISEAVLKPIKSKTPPLLAKDAPTISFALAPFPIGSAGLKTATKPSPMHNSTGTSTAAPTMSSPSMVRPIVTPAAPSNPPPLKILDFWSPKEPKPQVISQPKHKLPNADQNKMIWSGPFKVPSKPAKESPVKKPSAVDANNKSTVKKPIIVNNVQRPTQADTPRPLMAKARGAHSTTKLTPILPKLAPAMKSDRIASNNTVRLGAGTEIKEITAANARQNDVKIYGPGLNMPYGSCSPAYVPSYPSPSILNYALMNSAAPVSSRPDLHFTPIYSANLPSYAPNSPNYAPAFTVPNVPTNKYTNRQSPAAGGPLTNGGPKPLSPLANVDKKPAVKVENDMKNHTKSMDINKHMNGTTKSASPEKMPMKRTLAEAIVSATKPTDKDKDPKVQSLLNSCNINFPSSLSITLTSEENDPTSNNPLFNRTKHQSPVNNFIEIVKLPDIPADEANKISKGTATSPKPMVISDKCSSSDIKAIVNELNNKANEAKRLALSPNKSIAPPQQMSTPKLPAPKTPSTSTPQSGISISIPKLSPIGKDSLTSIRRTSPNNTSPTKMPTSPPIINGKIDQDTFQAKFLQSILEKRENDLKALKQSPSPPTTKSAGHSPSTSSATPTPKVGRPRKNSTPADGAPPRKKERKNAASENKPAKNANNKLVNKNQLSALDLSAPLMPALSSFSNPTAAASKQLQTLANNNDLPMDIPTPINISAALFMDAMARVRNPGLVMPGFLPMSLNPSAAALWEQMAIMKANREAFVQSLKNKNQHGDA